MALQRKSMSEHAHFFRQWRCGALSIGVSMVPVEDAGEVLGVFLRLIRSSSVVAMAEADGREVGSIARQRG